MVHLKLNFRERVVVTISELRHTFIILANSASTDCRLMILLLYLFVISRNLLLGVFLPRKIITIVRKVTINCRQASVMKGVLLLVRVLEYFGKIFEKYL